MSTTPDDFQPITPSPIRKQTKARRSTLNAGRTGVEDTSSITEKLQIHGLQTKTADMVQSLPVRRQEASVLNPVLATENTPILDTTGYRKMMRSVDGVLDDFSAIDRSGVNYHLLAAHTLVAFSAGNHVGLRTGDSLDDPIPDERMAMNIGKTITIVQKSYNCEGVFYGNIVVNPLFSRRGKDGATIKFDYHEEQLRHLAIGDKKSALLYVLLGINDGIYEIDHVDLTENRLYYKDKKYNETIGEFNEVIDFIDIGDIHQGDELEECLDKKCRENALRQWKKTNKTRQELAEETWQGIAKKYGIHVRPNFYCRRNVGKRFENQNDSTENVEEYPVQVIGRIHQNIFFEINKDLDALFYTTPISAPPGCEQNFDCSKRDEQQKLDAAGAKLLAQFFVAKNQQEQIKHAFMLAMLRDFVQPLLLDLLNESGSALQEHTNEQKIGDLFQALFNDEEILNENELISPLTYLMKLLRSSIALGRDPGICSAQAVISTCCFNALTKFGIKAQIPSERHYLLDPRSGLQGAHGEDFAFNVNFVEHPEYRKKVGIKTDNDLIIMPQEINVEKFQKLGFKKNPIDKASAYICQTITCRDAGELRVQLLGHAEYYFVESMLNLYTFLAYNPTLLNQYLSICNRYGSGDDEEDKLMSGLSLALQNYREKISQALKLKKSPIGKRRKPTLFMSRDNDAQMTPMLPGMVDAGEEDRFEAETKRKADANLSVENLQEMLHGCIDDAFLGESLHLKAHALNTLVDSVRFFSSENLAQQFYTGLSTNHSDNGMDKALTQSRRILGQRDLAKAQEEIPSVNVKKCCVIL